MVAFARRRMNTEYLQFRAISLLARILPRGLAYWIGARLSDARFPHQPGLAAALVANFRRLLAFQGARVTDAELEELARETSRSFSRHLADLFHFTRMSRRQVERLFTFEGLEHVDAALALGKGIIALSAHLGSYELTIASLTALGYPLTAVSLPMKDPKTDALFERRRRMHCKHLVPLGGSMRAILEALRRNETACLMIDMDFMPRMGMVRFFGAPARMPMGPARLAAMTGAPLMPGFVHQRPGGRYFFRIHPPILPGPDSTPESLEERIVAVLEREILEDPTQWFAFVDFWNPEASLAMARESMGT